MRNLLSRLHRAVLLFAAWGWPILLADLLSGAYKAEHGWASWVNGAAFIYVLCIPVWPVTFLYDRERREAAMARLCGVREGDEREQAVTGEAARFTLLLGLALQSILLALSLVSVDLSYDPAAKARGEKGGMLSVGLGFSTERHLDPFGWKEASSTLPESGWHWGGNIIAPSSFPLLALLILVQLGAFRAFAGKRYEGAEA